MSAAALSGARFVEYREVGPEQAHALLAKALPHKEPPSLFVRRLAEDMRAGKWRKTSNPIVFDENGYLADGVARLRAVIASETTQTFAVAQIGRKTPDLFEVKDDGRQGRDRGIATVTAHAERVDEGWADRAFALLAAYCAKRPPPFIAPHFSDKVLREYGFDVPPGVSKRAWGGVFQRARRAGLLAIDGYESYGNATTHVHPVPRWRVV